MSNERQAWNAMRKFSDDELLTDQEWEALSQLTMINREHLYFGPENVRWATTDAERASNLAFYRSL